MTKNTDEIVITADSGEKTYDGTALTPTQGEDGTGEDVGYTYTANVLASGDVLEAVVSGSQTDAGSSASTVTSYKVVRKAADGTEKDVTSYYTFGTSVDGTLKVNKKAVTIASADLEKKYDGTALVNGDTALKTNSGWVATQGVDVTFSGSQTDVGESANAFSYTAKEGTNLDNYEITKTEGTLKVTSVTEKVTVTVTANSGSGKYDGTEHTVTGYTVSIDNDLYTEADFTFIGNATVKGTDAGSYEMEMKSEDFINTNKNFTNVEFVIVPGTLEIEKRTVTLASESGEKYYDGTPLTRPEVTVSGDGFVEGEVTEVEATGSVTTVDEGEVTNTITFTAAEGFKADNYLITVNEGTLKIKASDGLLVITSSTNHWMYDGEVHTDDTYTVTYDGKVAERVVRRRLMALRTARTASEPQVFMLSTGDTVTITPTAEGVRDYDEGYNQNNTFTYVISNASSYNRVEVEVGTLSIDKRTVTLTSATDSKVYDGTALTNEEVTVSGDGFVAGEGADYTVTGSQILVGESNNTFDYKLKEGTLADNYTITKAEGTLTVTDGSDTPDEPVKDDLVVTKEAEDTVYKLGEEVTFTIKVTNIYDEAKTITLTEIDGVTLEQSIYENVPAGETITVTVTHTITEEDILKGSFENTVTATVGKITKEAKKTVTTEEANPHLTIDKVTTSKPAEGTTYKLGETITYKITVSNDGNLTITDIKVEDKLTGDKWTIDTLAPEGSETFTTEHVVTEEDILNGKVVNVATVTGEGPDDEHDPEPGDGTSEDKTDPKDAHLTIVKEATSEPANGEKYDLGEKITYKITVTNDGNVTITDITVTDELTGDEWTIDSLVPGEDAVFETSYTVTKKDLEEGKVVNVATATGIDPEEKEPEVVPGTDEEPTTEPEPVVPQTGTVQGTVILTTLSTGSILGALMLMMIRRKRKEEEE